MMLELRTFFKDIEALPGVLNAYVDSTGEIGVVILYFLFRKDGHDHLARGEITGESPEDLYRRVVKETMRLVDMHISLEEQ